MAKRSGLLNPAQSQGPSIHETIATEAETAQRVCAEALALVGERFRQEPAAAVANGLMGGALEIIAETKGREAAVVWLEDLARACRAGRVIRGE